MWTAVAAGTYINVLVMVDVYQSHDTVRGGDIALGAAMTCPPSYRGVGDVAHTELVHPHGVIRGR